VIVWEITRASAFVAFGCYTLSIVWGILVASRTLPNPAKPEFDYHRFLSSLGLAATLVHVVTVLISHANAVHWPALFYIGASPAAVAGVSATWLIVLLPVSFAVKKRGRLKAKSWRRLHYLGYTVWVLALLHALGAGTDARTRASLAGYGLAAGLVIGAATWRLVSRKPAKKPKPAPAPARAQPEAT
jgi:DMSO/TMAO reductase YedYZ heme-binding membrane subunit